MEKAVIRWFDSTSGEGMVRVGDETIYMHFTAIEGWDKNNYHWPSESDQLKKIAYNTPCEVEVIREYSWTQIGRCVITK